MFKKRSHRKKVLASFRIINPPGIETFSGTIRGLRKLVRWDVKQFIDPLRLTLSDIQTAKENGIDGILVGHPLQEDLTPAFLESDIPLVVVGNTDQRLFRRRKNIAFLEVDNRRIGEMAADYFASLGKFRTYAFLPDIPSSRWSRIRLRGFRARMREIGESVVVFDGKDIDSWICSLKKPIALFLSGDYMSSAAMSACERNSLSIPSDVSILGVDNNPILCESARVPLSSIEPPFAEIGYEAVRILQRIMSAKTPVRRPIIYRKPPVGVVDRTSTTHTHPSASLVKRAIHYIQTNVNSGITAKDVSRYLGVSPQLLSLRFAQLEKTSVRETIIRTRIANVKKILSTTSLPLEKIAKQTGFHSKCHLAHQFAKYVKSSPGNWRMSKATKDAPVKHSG